MNIFCTGNPSKKNFYKALNKISEISNIYKHNLYLNKDIDSRDINLDLISFKEFTTKKTSDFIFSIGGDGALLNTIRLMGSHQIPVLGIHIGNLGFLNQINFNKIDKALDTFFKLKEYVVQEYSLLSAEIYDINNKKKGSNLIALNDIVISQGNLLRLIKVRVDSDGNHLNKYACDGLIFSTPLGSTAYSLSAGGPIVSPTIDSIIVTPVSPHSLSARPIVLDGSSEIEISFDEFYSKINITADGQSQMKINSHSKIKINKSNITAKFIYFKDMESYYYKLRNKLNWFGKY